MKCPGPVRDKTGEVDMKTSMRGEGERANRGWTGIPTFLRSPYAPDLDDLDADIAVLGVPFDEGSPYVGGSRLAPRTIREHSLRFDDPNGFFDIESGRSYLAREMSQNRIVDIGDVDILPTNPAGSYDNATNMVRRVLAQGVFPVALGGDHGISFPVVRAFEGPIHVVHFDAHLDYCAEHLGMNHTNGQPFRQIHELSQVTGLTQVGIRSLRNGRTEYEEAIAAGSRIVPMSELRSLGPDGVAGLGPDGAKCYISMDVDALDAPLIPGCISAEPNGMTYAELRDCFGAIAAKNEIVGFDFVEVNPMVDVGGGATSYLGAHLVIECLGLVCEQDWWKARVCA